MFRMVAERVLGGLTHLIALVGTTHLVTTILMDPRFPWNTLLFLAPNIILARIYFDRSRLLYAQVMQALIAHVTALGLALIPWTIWALRVTHVLSDKWSKPSLPSYGFTPEWTLTAVLLIFLGAGVFVLMADAACDAFEGRVFQYPLVGRIARQIADFDPEAAAE